MAIISPLVAKGNFYYAEYNGGLRKQAVQNIVIHHYAGVVQAQNSAYWARWLSETSGTRFVNANYALGTNGELYCILPEEYRPWTTGGSDPDERSITVEVMNATGYPSWAVYEEQIVKLSELVADVAKRYGWSKVTYTGGADGSDPVRGKQGMLLMHKWYGATSCPGPFLAGRFDRIAEAANAILQKDKQPQTPAPKPVTEEVLHRVQIGAFRERKGAEEWEAKARAEGLPVWINLGADAWYRVQLGAFTDIEKARQKEAELKARGWPAYINSSPSKQQKSLSEIANEVIAGKWGNWPEREKKLVEAGYNYKAVQGRVEEILSGQRKEQKTIERLAYEVLEGKWGNDPVRSERLKKAGYDAAAVQARVNALLGIGR